MVGKATPGGRHPRTASAVPFQGQDAGTAAAMAVREGIPRRAVRIKALQEALKKAGVEIP